MDIQGLRESFPVTKQAVFLNNAAESPLNTRVRQRLEEYLTVASEEPQNKPSVRHAVRKQLAGLLGGTADQYALVTSTGVGIGIVAAGLNWRAGDNVVVPVDEHWNNTFPWLALQKQGVEVRLVPTESDSRIDPEQVAAMTDNRTRLVAAAAVRFNSGFRTDLKRLSTVAHACGALFLVDGTQAAGVVPMNVDDDGIDILACAGFKWLLGLPGTGFLYVRRSVQDVISPVLPGMFAAENHLRHLHYLPDARRYETGSIAYSLFHAWTAGLELLQEVGVEVIHRRAILLTDRLIMGLRAENKALLTPVDSIDERSAILLFSAGSAQDNLDLYERLKARRIIITLRGDVCRVSPSFFNTEDDIDLFLNAVALR
jgi:selenocysteine lyase/cysteine desulfurase